MYTINEIVCLFSVHDTVCCGKLRYVPEDASTVCPPNSGSAIYFVEHSAVVRVDNSSITYYTTKYTRLNETLILRVANNRFSQVDYVMKTN